jgi:RHS repeat-associated protein
VTTYYFYGLTGLTSEFSTASGASAAASTDRLQYRVGEQTGTAVMLLDSSGNPRENNRVFPFGEPWLEFAASNNNEKFTTYQHDNDAGSDLDYAMARYYASRSGRFMTPDPGHVGAHLEDPQSWNAYAYTANDPINRTDPSGLDYILCTRERSCVDSYSDFDFFRNFVMSRDILLTGDGEGGSGYIIHRTDGNIGSYYYYDPNPPSLDEQRFQAVVQGTQMAAPAVNLIGEGFKNIGLVANPPVTMGILCAAGAPECTKTGVALAALPGVGKLGNAGRLLPQNARIFQNIRDAFSHLQRYHGIDPVTASERLHAIKAAWGLGPAENVLVDRTGGVWHSVTREFLGSLTEGGAKRLR